MKMIDEQNPIWQTLYNRQLPRVKQYACQEYLDGLTILNLPADRVPDLDFLNEKIMPRTGREVVRCSAPI